MQLRQYAAVLLRHWWLIGLLPLLAGAFSLLTYQEAAPTWGQTLRYSVSFLPVELERTSQDPRLGAVQASEYVVDDLTLIFTGSRFADMAARYLPEGQGGAALVQAIHAEKTHRLIALTLTGPTQGAVEGYASAVKQAVATDLEPMLGEMWDERGVRMELIHDSGVASSGSGLRSKLDVPLRVALALVAALALAFALDYLDDSLRTRTEAEALVGPVLGEIPK